MRLARDLSGRALAQALEALGYQITRQTGSHLRLTTQQQGEHHVTPLRVGTLAGILDEVAKHFKIERAALIQQLVGSR